MRADKRFGQHFLEPAWAQKLVAAIGAQPSETIVEVGPGRGALTWGLAATGARVVAIEIDRRLAAALAAAAPPNVEVVAADFLEADLLALLNALPGGWGAAAAKARVAGNLPYNVSSPILFRLLALHDAHALFADATLMVQREVADRLLARRGTREYGVLTVLVTTRATVTPILQLPPGAFRPAPAVSSTVVRLTFHPPAVEGDLRAFDQLVRALFQHRRKTLLNGVRALLRPGGGVTAEAILAEAGIETNRRPETLDLTEFSRLVSLLPVPRP